MKNFILILVVFIILLQFILEVNTQDAPAPKDGAAAPAPGAAPKDGAPAPAPGTGPKATAPGGATPAGAASMPAIPSSSVGPSFKTLDDNSKNGVSGGSILGGIIGSLIFTCLIASGYFLVN